MKFNLNKNFGRFVDSCECSYEYKDMMNIIKEYSANKSLTNGLTPRFGTHIIHLVVFSVLCALAFICAMTTKIIRSVFRTVGILLCALPWAVYTAVGSVVGIPIAMLAQYAMGKSNWFTKIFYKA